jgi:hypothetical protein
MGRRRVYLSDMQPTLLSLATNIAVLVVIAGVLSTLAWQLWLTYVQTAFLRSIKWVLLEVRPPKDVFKSPAAMELMLNALYQTGGTGNWYDRYWKGQVRNWFSLEIASLEGSIHFYIRTNEKFRKLIESQIYAQYPQAEVFEVEDYMNRIPDFTKDGPVSLLGNDFVLTNKEEVIPIKTYIDYGLDRAVGSLEEEERIDPITPMLEFMGSIGRREYILFQMNIRAATERHTVTEKKDGETIVKEKQKWTDKAKEVIKKLGENLVEKDKDGKVIGSRRPTKGESMVIESIERNANKFAFDVGMRAIYLTVDGKFDGNRFSGLTGMLKQYTTVDFNGFKAANTTTFDYPWQDLFKTRIVKKKKDMLDGYRARAFFYGSFSFDKLEKYFTHPNAGAGKQFVLSTEEIATLYHLPGRVAATPTFERLDSTKSEPPVNLPV